MFSVEEIRKDFPMLDNKTMSGKPLVYLDNGATTFKPYSVIEAVTNYYTNQTCNAHRGDYQLAADVSAQYEEARDAVAKLIHCQSKEVVFTSGASMSLNLAAYGYGQKNLQKGDVILITEAEHASNVLPWFRVAEVTGAVVEYIPLTDEGRVTPENLKKALHDKVKIVAFAAVSNVLGYVNDVKELVRLAHEQGAKAVVDGAQAVPHMEVNVSEWDIDFLAFSAHKMCGPTGVGVLYGKYNLLEETDPFMLGGGANARFDMCGNVQLKHAPFKFEAGTPPIEGVLGLKAACEYIMSVGYENISRHEHELRTYLTDQIKKLDHVILYNPNAETGIVTFNVRKIFSQDVASYLGTKGICVRSGSHCAKILVNFLKTSDTVRASLYFYNTKEDCDALVEALKTTTIENCVGIFF
ncbi:MAG: SufS family cysteine desulfurase [Erysipelotrichaceae bacterium]|nr:SufS family cysteine desulfurase [Erysipelotrichaceae bacterium]